MAIREWKDKARRRRESNRARFEVYVARREARGQTARFRDWWPGFWAEYTSWWSVPALPAPSSGSRVPLMGGPYGGTVREFPGDPPGVIHCGPNAGGKYILGRATKPLAFHWAHW